jgi:hypothetical protein
VAGGVADVEIGCVQRDVRELDVIQAHPLRGTPTRSSSFLLPGAEALNDCVARVPRLRLASTRPFLDASAGRPGGVPDE